MNLDPCSLARCTLCLQKVNCLFVVVVVVVVTADAIDAISCTSNSKLNPKGTRDASAGSTCWLSGHFASYICTIYESMENLLWFACNTNKAFYIAVCLHIPLGMSTSVSEMTLDIIEDANQINVGSSIFVVYWHIYWALFKFFVMYV